MLILHFANRQEALADLLTEALGRPSDDLFTPDEVIVASMAMRRAVTLQTARAHGVCANLRFGFLAQWLWEQGSRVLATLAPAAPMPQRTALSAQAPWQPALLTWRVLATFDDPAWVAAQPGMTRLARYLAQADAVTRFDLAQRVAGLVDQLITYRPDWLAAWSDGRQVLPPDGTDDEAWQAALWRRLQAQIAADARHAGTDPLAAHSLAAALAALPAGRSAALQVAGLPATAHLFCLPTIAPVHLALLQQLARWMDLHVYAINPCAEYWFDVVEPRRLARLVAAGRAQHAEVGHRLLAAWGRQAQAQLAALVDAGGDFGAGVVDDDHYQAAHGRSLLAALQNSILTLQDLRPGSLAFDPADRSIALHVCHSLTRQLEVLHDQLLAVLAQPGAPGLGEILVVVPDLVTAAPLIDSVFGTAPPQLALPFTITGRAISQANPAARALLDLLALAGSRCAASAVFGLLQQPVVARCFGLDDEALARVHGWLLDAGVHWALDGDQRADLGLGDGDRHSFADGLDRLFLGHVLPTAAAPFDGRLPAGEPEGSAAQALGALWQFVQQLDGVRRRSAQPLPAAAWPALLADLVDGFLHAETAGAEALAELRAALRTLAERWQASAPGLPLALDVVAQALTQALDDPALGGVPTGRITFSALPSLRGLPYRMVCVLGLDDGVFPAPQRPAEFDLIARHPRPGDRQRRADDRNLFLDLLLATRERLYLSHTGRSVRDNTRLPPSVLVAELLDVLVPAIAAPPGQVRAQLVVEHPLQAFDARAFQPDGDPRQRSFHAEYAAALAAGRRAAQALVVEPPPEPADAEPPAPDTTGRDDTPDGITAVTTDDTTDDSPDAGDDAVAEAEAGAPAFFARPLAADPGHGRQVTLAQLQAFFRHPARWLLQQRLGLQLRAADEVLDDAEPFLPGFDARDALARHLLPPLLQAARGGPAVADADLIALAAAGTTLPAGPIGASHVHTELPLLRAHAQALARATAAPLRPPHAVVLDLPATDDAAGGAPWSLALAFGDLRADGLVRHRYADARPADHVATWIDHLALCAAAPAGVAGRTQWIGRGARFAFRAVDDPLSLLARLLALFERGRAAPLPFFPKTAWAWIGKGRSLGAARAAWVATAARPFAEQADAWNRLALRGRPDPLAHGSNDGLADFEAVSLAVLAPLLDHLDDPEAAP